MSWWTNKINLLNFYKLVAIRNYTETNPIQNPGHSEKKMKKPRNKRVDFVVAIIINFILLYLVNRVLDWQIQFITGDWEKILPLFNFSIILTIVANAFFLFYHAKWLYFLARTFLDTIGFVITLRIYTVFPFDIYY